MKYLLNSIRQNMKAYSAGYSYKELCEELHMNKSALGMKIKRIKEKILKNE
jgi:predicted DNA-binding protein YlxM (UPF0122 family)